MNKLLIPSIICILILSSCVREPAQTSENLAELYFLSADGSSMVTEQAALPEDEGEVLHFVLTKLLEGPQSPEHKRAIAEGTALLGIEYDDTTARINLSKEYYNVSSSERIWSRCTLVYTACSVEGVEKIEIWVEGQAVVSQSTGEPLGAIGKEDMVTDPSQVDPDTRLFTLYFADANSMYLIPETRRVSVKEGERQSKVVVEELLKGPKNEHLYSVLPAEVKVLSTEVKDGVCFVNFSPEFISKAPGGSTWESLAVYSIVNSLCELENIKKVQILVEGKKVEGFGHMDLSEPFSRNDEITKPN